jgi:hypothetical protein
MRYRKLSPRATDGSSEGGDYSWGHGLKDYHRDTPEAVGQAVKTRLLLFQGEWFLDIAAGTPWGGFPQNKYGQPPEGQILGRPAVPSRDFALQMRVLDTPGVLSVLDYESDVDTTSRAFIASAVVNTIYGRLRVNIPSLNPRGSNFGLSYAPLGGDVAL